MELGVSTILGPTRHGTRRLRQKNRLGLTGDGTRCLKKTYWAREGMEFGVSKERVGPDKTLGGVSQKDIMIWAMNRVPVACHGPLRGPKEAQYLQEAF